MSKTRLGTMITTAIYAAADELDARASVRDLFDRLPATKSICWQAIEEGFGDASTQVLGLARSVELAAPQMPLATSYGVAHLCAAAFWCGLDDEDVADEEILVALEIAVGHNGEGGKHGPPWTVRLGPRLGP
jgi:hypothetical protein